MAPKLQRIFDEAIHLSPDKRTEHLESMVESFDAEPSGEIQRAWVEEAERRLALYKSDCGGALSEEEMFDGIGIDDNTGRSIPLPSVAVTPVKRKTIISGGRFE